MAKTVFLLYAILPEGIPRVILNVAYSFIIFQINNDILISDNDVG